MSFKEIINKTKNDSAFIPEILFLDCLANFMRQNPSVKIELKVYSQTNDNSIQLSNDRALALAKLLKKKKIKKERITAKGLLISKEEIEKQGMIEIYIL